MLNQEELGPTEYLGRRINSSRDRNKARRGIKLQKLFNDAKDPQRISVDRVHDNWLDEVQDVAIKHYKAEGRTFYGWLGLSQQTYLRRRAKCDSDAPMRQSLSC